MEVPAQESAVDIHNDGLNLLRVDERYDSAGGTIDAYDYWRIKEIATHKPGSLGNMLGKKVYNYSSTNYTDTPTTSAFYAYHYDAVGNVLWVTDSGGVLSHSFSQDAFGNALATGNFSGTNWTTARAAGITEHQTGKWIDPFTGLYFFHARFYDPVVGSFVGRDPVQMNCGSASSPYSFCLNLPTSYYDDTGADTESQHKLFSSSCFTALNEDKMQRMKDLENAMNTQCGLLEATDYSGAIESVKLRQCMAQQCQTITLECTCNCVDNG